MRKIQTLGIVLAVVMLFGSIPMGFSEPLKEQLEKGIEPEKIQCDNSNVLVQRPNGKLTCASERTAEKLNWEIINNSEINNVVMEPVEQTTHESENTVATDVVDFKPGIMIPVNLLDVIPQDITFDYVVDTTDDPDAFALRMATFFEDTIIEKNGPNKFGHITYDTKKGLIKLYSSPIDGSVGAFTFSYTFYGIDRIHPRDAESVTASLLDELGIKLDGTEYSVEGSPSSNYTHKYMQTKGDLRVISNMVVVDFKPGYTFIYIGHWNDNLSEMNLYDLEQARENARDYIFTVPELTAPDCDIGYNRDYDDDSLFNPHLKILEGRPVYTWYAGTCQVEEWASHYWSFDVIVDAITGNPLYVQSRALF